MHFGYFEEKRPLDKLGVTFLKFVLHNMSVELKRSLKIEKSFKPDQDLR